MKTGTSIIDWLEEAEKNYGDKIVYRDADENSEVPHISFRELSEATGAIGTALIRILLESGEWNREGICNLAQPIAVMTGRHIYTPACFLGVNRAGLFYAPIDADLPDSRVIQILDVAKPKYIIADRGSEERVRKVVPEYTTVLMLEDLLAESRDREILSLGRYNRTEMDPMYMIFTSGSTGRPKGVLTSHHSLMCYLDGINDVIHLKEDDVMGNQSPLDYIAAVRDMYLPLLSGCETVIIPRSTTAMPEELFGILNSYGVTTLCWSASGLEVLAKLGDFNDDKLPMPEHIRRIVFSGSVMAPKYLKMWQEALPETTFINQYGPTEATASCTYYVIDEKVEEDSVVPIGKPYKHYKVFLLSSPEDEEGVGEICVGGPALAIGYYRDQIQTDKAFIRNPNSEDYYERIYLTGDLGKYDEKGNLLFLGRKDRQVKHLGHRIELDEIELAAANIEGLKESVSMYDGEKALLYLFYTGEASSKDIALHFRSNMPGYMVPRKIVKLEEMPLLPNGKLNRMKLKEMM